MFCLSVGGYLAAQHFLGAWGTADHPGSRFARFTISPVNGPLVELWNLTLRDVRAGSGAVRLSWPAEVDSRSTRRNVNEENSGGGHHRASPQPPWWWSQRVGAAAVAPARRAQRRAPPARRAVLCGRRWHLGGLQTITYAQEQEWYDYNSGSSSGNATANQVVLNQVLRGSPSSTTRTVQMDDEYGTIEKLSDSPLTVKYTFNDKAVWSDGQPVGCADFLLAWAANSGRYNKDGTINQRRDDPGRAGLHLRYRLHLGHRPDAEAGLCRDGDKSVTLTYDKPFVDWQVAIGTSAGSSILPAHVAAKAAGIDTAGLVKAVETDDVATLTKVADFWNTGWTLDKAKGLPDATTISSAGPYYVAAWDPGQSVTLKKNDKWWGTPAKTDTVVIRYISQDQQVSALASGEVDVIEPQPNPDVNAALNNLGNAVKADYGSQFTYEHMDLSVKNGFANEKLREALFKCAPRQQIVDNLIVPSNPDAKLLNSLMLMDSSPATTRSRRPRASPTTPMSTSKAPRRRTRPPARRRARPSGSSTSIRTPRRTNEVALLKAACDPVGFNIQDAAVQRQVRADPGPPGDYDIALFAWAGSGLLGSIPGVPVHRWPELLRLERRADGPGPQQPGHADRHLAGPSAVDHGRPAAGGQLLLLPDLHLPGSGGHEVEHRRSGAQRHADPGHLEHAGLGAHRLMISSVGRPAARPDDGPMTGRSS